MLVTKKYARLASKLSALALVLSVGGCAHNDAAPVAPSASDVSSIALVAATGAWKLQSLTRSDSTTVTVPEPGRFTIEFAERSNRLAMRVDCNRATGTYTASGTTLTVGPIASTRAYCSSAPFDGEYLRVLGGESLVTATATSLILSSARGSLRFGR